MVEQIFAGVGLGLLVGLLVGLSSSPVVSIVVSALAAGMITLLGFTRSHDPAKASAPRGSAWRLGSFGLACTVAVLLSISIRTHNALSPSLDAQVSDVKKAGFSDTEAKEWVTIKNIGAALGGSGKTKTNNDATAVSVLFNAGNSDECQYFDTSRYKDTAEHLLALRQMRGTYAEYAAKIASLKTDRQKAVLDALRTLYCPQ